MAITRKTVIKDNDFTSKRYLNELSFDFMYAYLDKKKPELVDTLLDMTEVANSTQDNVAIRKWFAEECSEIILVAETKLTNAQRAKMLREQRAKRNSENITDFAKVV